MKSWLLLLSKMGMLPPYIQASGITSFWDVCLLLLLSVFVIGGIGLVVGFCYYLANELFEQQTGLTFRNLITMIYKRKLMDYIRKRRIKVGDIVAFRYDDTIIPLKVTDHHVHSKTILAKPLRSFIEEGTKIRLVSSLAELKQAYNYEEIEVLNKRTMMKVLYGK